LSKTNLQEIFQEPNLDTEAD